MATIFRRKSETGPRAGHFDIPIPVASIEGPLLLAEGRLAGTYAYRVSVPGRGLTGQRMNAREFAAAIHALPQGARWIEIAGQDPSLFDLWNWIDAVEGYKVSVVTDGAIPRDWLALADLITIRPWMPSTRGVWSWKRLGDFLLRFSPDVADVVFCLPIAGPEDLEFACELASRHPDYPLYLQSAPLEGSALEGYRRLALQVAGSIDLKSAVVVPPIGSQP